MATVCLRCRTDTRAMSPFVRCRLTPASPGDLPPSYQRSPRGSVQVMRSALAGRTVTIKTVGTIDSAMSARDAHDLRTDMTTLPRVGCPHVLGRFRHWTDTVGPSM